MPGLQRGILTVIGEAQELTRVLRKVALFERTDGRETQNGGRAAASFRTQGRELCKIALPRRVGHATVEAEHERRCDKDTFLPFAVLVTQRADMDMTRQAISSM